MKLPLKHKKFIRSLTAAYQDSGITPTEFICLVSKFYKQISAAETKTEDQNNNGWTFWGEMFKVIKKVVRGK